MNTERNRVTNRNENQNFQNDNKIFQNENQNLQNDNQSFQNENKNLQNENQNFPVSSTLPKPNPKPGFFQ